MKKTIAIILALLTLAFCFAGCGKSADSDLKTIQKNGKMVIGITDYAPMDYRDANGEWTGFDAEFARLVCEKLKVTPEFIEINWDNKYFELSGKTIDCIWNGMTISDEALNNASVSNPYVENAQVVVMPKDKAVSSAADLAGLNIAVEAGSAGEEAVVDNGITEYTAVLDQSTAIMEVASGTADACVIDITMANALTAPGASYENLTACVVLTSEEYGVAFRKDSDMTAKFNEIMADMMKDGTLDALAAKYELTLVK